MRVICLKRLSHMLAKFTYHKDNSNQFVAISFKWNFVVYIFILRFFRQIISEVICCGTHKNQSERCRVHRVELASSSWWLQGGRCWKPTLCCLYSTCTPQKILLFIQFVIKTRFSDRRTACCLLHYRLDSVQRMRRPIFHPHAFWSGRHFGPDERHVTVVNWDFRFFQFVIFVIDFVVREISLALFRWMLKI